MFSMANAVGKPLAIDKATDNQTRPRCARVKVEVDLLKELPKRIHINCIEEESGEVKWKWQETQYDYLPKYCTHCKLQGHDMQGLVMTTDQVNNISVSDQVKKEKVQEEELHGEIEAQKEPPDGNQESESITGMGEANTSLLQVTTTQEE